MFEKNLYFVYNRRMIKKILFQILLFIGILFTFLGGGNGEVEAQNTLILPNHGSYGGILEDNRAVRAVNTVTGSSNFIESAVNVLFSRENIVSINVVIGIIAILYLVFIGMKYIFSGGEEEKTKKLNTQIGYVLLGLFTVSVAHLLAFVYINPDVQVNQSFLTNADIISDIEAKAMQIKKFIQILIGGIALISILMTGYQLITSQGKEEAIDKEKAVIVNFIIASILILAAEILVRGVFFFQGANRSELSNQAAVIGVKELVGLTNTLLTLVASLAVFMLILASFYYMISMGDEERTGRAKRIIISTLIALIICFSAYTLVRFFF